MATTPDYKSNERSRPLPLPPLTDDDRNRAQKLLKGFPEGTEEAYYKFRETEDTEALKTLLGGMLGFYLPSANDNHMKIVGSDVDLQTIGIDSLGMTEMVFQVEELFDVSVADEDLAKVTTVNDISVYIKKRLDEGDV